MAQTLDQDQPETDVRDTLLEVRAKLKVALHLAQDRAGRRHRRVRWLKIKRG